MGILVVLFAVGVVLLGKVGGFWVVVRLARCYDLMTGTRAMVEEVYIIFDAVE